MNEYRVRFTGENGRESCREFTTMEQAQALYDSLNGEAVIQKWSPEARAYEDEVFPIYEF